MATTSSQATQLATSHVETPPFHASNTGQPRMVNHAGPVPQTGVRIPQANPLQQFDVENGPVQAAPEPPGWRSFWTKGDDQLRSAIGKIIWGFLLINTVEFCQVAVVTTAVDHNRGNESTLPTDLYSRFESTKFLLFVTLWSYFAVIWMMARLHDWPLIRRVPYIGKHGMDVSVIFVVTWIFWLSGMSAQGAWLGKVYYCTPGEEDCRELLGSTRAIGTSIGVFAAILLCLWTVPTIDVVRGTYNDLHHRR